MSNIELQPSLKNFLKEIYDKKSKSKKIIRKDKSNLTIHIHQKWVSTEIKRLYNNIRLDMNPNDFKYEDIQQHFIRKLNLANLLNYRFSKQGDFIGARQFFQKENV